MPYITMSSNIYGLMLRLMGIWASMQTTHENKLRSWGGDHAHVHFAVAVESVVFHYSFHADPQGVDLSASGCMLGRS